MFVEVGMMMKDVLAVKPDLKVIHVEEYDLVLYQEYVGVAEDGGLLCVYTEDDVVVAVEKGCYV